MTKVYTGHEALTQAKGILKCSESKILATAILPGDETTATVYEFLGDYYLSVIGSKTNLCFFEKITKEEADNIVYNIKGLSHIGSMFQFGGF